MRIFSTALDLLFFFFFDLKGAKDHVWGAEEIFIGYKLKYLLTTRLFFIFQGAMGPKPSNSSVLDEQFEEFFFQTMDKNFVLCCITKSIHIARACINCLYIKNLFFLLYILTFQNISHQIIYFTLHSIKILIFLD